MPQSAKPISFAGACAVTAMVVAHAGTPATSLAFTPPPITNRSVDYADHHRTSASLNARASGGGGGSDSSNERTPVRLRRGRGGGGISLFSRLRVSASAGGLFNKSTARGSSGDGGGGGGGGDNAGGSPRDGGGADKTRCSATAAAAAAGVFKDGEPFVLEGVKNIRDLSSVEGYGIAPGRVFRTGHLSDATERDAKTLRDSTGLQTLVDLRSATELGHDELIHGDVYEGFINVGGGEHGGTGVWEGPTWDEAIVEDSNPAAGTVDGDTGSERRRRRRRYFISLIDESIYKKGVFQRLRRRHQAAVLALAPATMVSRRCKQKARSIFLKEINAGGLVLLNELLLQYSGDGINRVLRLLASKDRHPVALYCTAGKDRTGLVVALTLAVLGVPDEAIVDDYAKSDAAYKELADRDAMVGALSQQDLDPDTFLGAPPHVMEEVLRFIRVKYGSIDDYLDSIGFDAEWRARLRSALVTE
eukprot:g8129.t1